MTTDESGSAIETREQPAGSPAAEELRTRVAGLVRLNNALIFAVFVVGLGAVTYVRTTHVYAQPPSFLGWLTALRIALPIAALGLTALATQRAMQRCASAAGDEAVGVAQVLAAFVSCKRVSMFASAIAGLVASVCLLFGHRTLDVLLALLPLVLLLFTRPSVGALITFAGLVESVRQEQRAGTDAPAATGR